MALRDRVPMTDDDQSAHTEQVGAAVLLGVEAGPQPRRAGRSSMPPSLGPASLVDAAPFIRVNNDDEHPSSSLSATLPVKPSVTTTSAVFAQEVPALDVAYEIESRCLQQRVRRPGQLAPLARLFAYVQQPDARFGDPEDRPRVGGPEDAELEQMLGAAVGVRSGVEKTPGPPAPARW